MSLKLKALFSPVCLDVCVTECIYTDMLLNIQLFCSLLLMRDPNVITVDAKNKMDDTNACEHLMSVTVLFVCI